MTVQQWFNKFKNGNESPQDTPCTKHSHTIDNENSKKLLRLIMAKHVKHWGKHSLAVWKLFDNTSINLGNDIKWDNWSHKLAAAQKATWANASIFLLSHQRKDPFLDRVLTYDESGSLQYSMMLLSLVGITWTSSQTTKTTITSTEDYALCLVDYLGYCVLWITASWIDNQCKCVLTEIGMCARKTESHGANVCESQVSFYF